MMSALPDGTRQYVFQVPAREGRPAEQVRFITDDSDLIVPGDVRIARVFDPELPVPTFAQANPRMGSPRHHLAANAASPLKAQPNLSILCCAACWGTHAALTVDGCAGPALPCMDYNAAFDWLCCGGGC